MLQSWGVSASGGGQEMALGSAQPTCRSEATRPEVLKDPPYMPCPGLRSVDFVPHSAGRTSPIG